MRRKLWAAALVAAIIGGSATVAVGTAAGATGRTFEPDYRMSKQYVAVTTYKILRDHAPDTIGACRSDAKQELDRFDDLGSAGAFTRGAINCLHKLGYLSGLPGGTPSDFGQWSYWGASYEEGFHDEGYWLEAYRTDAGYTGMSLDCITSGDRDPESKIIIWFYDVALSPDDFEQVGVDYRLQGGQVIKERWNVSADSDSYIDEHGDEVSFTILESDDPGSFARQLRSAGTGDLRIVVRDGTETIGASFEIDGVLSSLNTLTCHQTSGAAGATGRTFEPDYRMSKQYVAVTTYKILRDHAPDTIGACRSDAKQELDRFDDLGSAGAFTRGAINCLHKLGYLSGLPGGTPSDFGQWSYWSSYEEGYHEEGYWLEAYRTDAGYTDMSLECITSGDRDPESRITIWFDDVALSPDDFEQVGVDYRLQGGQVIKERWNVSADSYIDEHGDEVSFTILESDDPGSFARQLRSAGTGDLRIVVRDGTETIGASFEIDGVLSSLNTLTCHQT